MIENLERKLDSWIATQKGDEISIQGVVRFPNDFSTSSLHLHQELTSKTGIPHFIVVFGRDKEHFCWPDLTGQVRYSGRGFSADLTEVVVADGGARIAIPVRAA